MSIGNGLYSKLSVPKKDVFLQEYYGDRISIDEEGYEKLIVRYGGKPEYLIHLCKDPDKPGHHMYLDCFRQAKANKCLASIANCRRNLEPMNSTTPPAQANCEFHVHDRRVRLIVLVESVRTEN